jgi:hypothetical protein
MSLQTSIKELDDIKVELKRLNSKRSTLLRRKNELETLISKYIKDQNLPGLKYNGVAIIVEEKVAYNRKPVKESEDDSIKLLQQYGIHSPRRVLSELAEMRRGDETVKEKVKTIKTKEK